MSKLLIAGYIYKRTLIFVMTLESILAATTCLSTYCFIANFNEFDDEIFI